MRHWLTALGALLIWLAPVSAVHAFGDTQCAASRFEGNLGCTANDVSLNSISVAGAPPASCVGGSTLPLNLNVTVNFGSSTRYDVGVFLSRDGKSPQLVPASGGAASCSVGVLPTTAPFWGSVASGGDGDPCGDGGGGLSGTFTMYNAVIPCTTDGSGSFNLYIPYVISWDQQSSNYCGDNTYPVPGTSSKCNGGTVSFPPGTTIVVLPAITITDGVTLIRTGDNLTYTVVISNTTGSTVTGAVFKDPAVADLLVSGVSCTAAGGATCPLSPTVAAMQGAGGIALPSMPNGGSLTFTITAQYTGTPAAPTTLTNTASVTLSGATNSASDTDTVVARPGVAKVFSPDTIPVGGISTLTITLTNPNGIAITGASFTDSYPAGMTNAGTPALSNGCGGTAVASPNGGFLSLSGGSIPANGSCSLSVAVTAASAGSLVNGTGSVSSANAGPGQEATATLTVLAPPLVAKAFSPATIALNGASTLTITLTNPNGQAITAAALIDNYPSTNLRNTALPTTTCAGGTVGGTVGGSWASLSGATIPAGGSCVLTVGVTATAAGSYANTTGSVITGNAGTGTAASATLTVLAPPLVSKTFTPEVIGVLDSSQLKITLTNPNATAITGASFTDNYPSGMTNASPLGLSNTCGGTVTATAGGASLRLTGGTIPASGSCVVSVNVTGALIGFSTDYLNSSGAVTTTNAGTGSASSATLTVAIVPSAQKDFSPDTIGVNGTSRLTVTLTNPWIGAITGVSFTDAYPANVRNTATPALSNTCGGTATAAANGSSLSLTGGTIPAGSFTDPATCTISVNVTGTAAGTYVNHTGVMSTTHWLFWSIADATATLRVLAPLTVAASFSPAAISVGGTSSFSIVLTNSNSIAVTGVGFGMTNPAGLANVGGVTSTCGGTATVASGTLSLVGGTVPANGSCTVTVTVTSSATGSYLVSTGTVSTSNAGSAGPATATLAVSGAQSFNAFEPSTAPNPGAITGRIYTKLAGTGFNLDIVAIAGAAQATGFSGNVKLELLANSTPGSNYGADNCPTSHAVIQTIASAAISGGRSTVNFPAVGDAYQDVRVRITYSGASPAVVICSTDGFAIRPPAILLTTTASASTTTPPLAANTPTVSAGGAFMLYATTASGTNYQGSLALDTLRLKAQTTTQDSTAQEGGVVGVLSPSSLTANQVPAAANAAYSEVGYLYLAPGAYRDETYTAIDQSSDCITDTADSNGDGMPDNLSAVLIGGRYGCWIGNGTVSLGRFIPSHFGVTGVVQNRSDLVPNTSNFTYMDEPMKLTLTVKAYRQMVTGHSVNPDDDITRNYTGVFAKLDAATLCAGDVATCASAPANDDLWFKTGCASGQCMGLGAFNDAVTDTGLSARLAVDTSIAAPSSSWSVGVGTFAAHVKLSRNTTPDGPYETVRFGAMPRDADGVTLPGPLATDDHKVDLDATTGDDLASNPDGTNERRWIFDTKSRFGRLWLGNAYGSDRRDLTIPFEAQYWNGYTFVRNGDDSLTAVAKANIGLGGHAPTNFDSSVDLGHIASGPFAVVSGAGSFILTKPTSVAGSPVAGSVDIVFALGASGSTTTNTSWTPSQGPSAGAGLGYLRSKWYGTNYDRDPTGRATFGIFGGKKGPIYIRESY